MECDRLEKWYHKNILFLGDAAHTMSPVAGQGINLAIRDSIVAANHLIDAFTSDKINPNKTFPLIQEERLREIKIMQTFQQKFGYFRLFLGVSFLKKSVGEVTKKNLFLGVSFFEKIGGVK